MIEKFKNVLKKELLIGIDDIDLINLYKAKDLIVESEKNGGRVHVTGIGKPSYVAGYIASLLSSIGTSSYELHGTEAVHGSSGQVKPQDVVIAISNSGETSELIATVNTLKKNGAKIISCTGNKNSWLSLNSDVCLIAKVNEEGDILNKAPRCSILLEIIVLQLLSIALQEHNKLDLEKYLSFHPGGNLGKITKDELMEL